MKKLNYTGITTLGTPLGMVEMRIAVNRDRGDVLRLVNEGLAEVIKNGEYDRIYRKWFVSDPGAAEQEQLLKAAKAALLTAYVPYGKKGLGAAVLTATGKVYGGASVENADSRLSVSAMRAAVTQAVGAGDLELRSAVQVDAGGAIVAPDKADCQFLYEFGRGTVVLTEAQKGRRSLPMVSDLLPDPVVVKMPVLNLE